MFSASRGLDHLLAVLVGAGQKEHVLAVEPLKARQRIGRDRLIGMADMRHAVRIGDRGRDVEGVAARWRRLTVAAGGRPPRGSLRRSASAAFLRSACAGFGAASMLVFAVRLASPISWPPSCAISWPPSSRSFFAAGFLALFLTSSWPLSWLSSRHAWFSSRASWQPSPWRRRAAACWPSSPCFLEVFFLALRHHEFLYVLKRDCRD